MNSNEARGMPMLWDPALTAEMRALERAMDRAQAQRDAERREQLLQLHERLSALLFWVAIMLALAAIGLQIGWGA